MHAERLIVAVVRVRRRSLLDLLAIRSRALAVARFVAVFRIRFFIVRERRRRVFVVARARSISGFHCFRGTRVRFGRFSPEIRGFRAAVAGDFPDGGEAVDAVVFRRGFVVGFGVVGGGCVAIFFVVEGVVVPRAPRTLSGLAPLGYFPVVYEAAHVLFEHGA